MIRIEKSVEDRLEVTFLSGASLDEVEAFNAEFKRCIPARHRRRTSKGWITHTDFTKAVEVVRRRVFVDQDQTELLPATDLGKEEESPKEM